MAIFPGGIYSPRTKENRAGAVYDANKKTITYVEDVVKLDDEVVAIETHLLNKEKVVWLPTEAFKIPALKSASFEEYGIGSALKFTDGNEEIALAKLHVPYDLDPATQPKLFLGWSSEAQSLNCRWKIEYLWRGPNQAMNGAADGAITDNYASSAVAFGLNMTEIQLANLAATDTCIILRITRLGDEAGDTLEKDAYLSGVCLVYKSNTLGK